MTHQPLDSLQRQVELKRAEESGKTVPGLSAEDMVLIEKRLAAFKKATDAQILAQFKIELTLLAARSREVPYTGFISIWRAGNRLNGDGDEKIYECSVCGGIVRDDAIDGDAAVCHHCGWVGASADLTGERVAKLPTQKWAKALLLAWKRVGGDADIVVKYHPDDMRSAQTKATKAVGAGGEKLLRLRARRQKLRYPLKNILVDTANGANLEDRFRAFLEA